MDEAKARISIIEHFADLEDPRIALKTEHKLIDVVVIAICAVICGADKWTQIEELGRTKQNWFRKFLELITVSGCIVTIDAMGCQRKKDSREDSRPRW